MKTTLPASPAKKAAVLESLVSSPRTRKQLEKRGVVTTPEEQREVAKLKALASDISSGLAKVIKKSRAKRSLGKLVNLNEKNISKAIKGRESILKGDTRPAGFILRERFGKTLYRRKMPKKSSTTELIQQVVLQETRKMF